MPALPAPAPVTELRSRHHTDVRSGLRSIPSGGSSRAATTDSTLSGTASTSAREDSASSSRAHRVLSTSARGSSPSEGMQPATSTSALAPARASTRRASSSAAGHAAAESPLLGLRAARSAARKNSAGSVAVCPASSRAESCRSAATKGAARATTSLPWELSPFPKGAFCADSFWNWPTMQRSALSAELGARLRLCKSRRPSGSPEASPNTTKPAAAARCGADKNPSNSKRRLSPGDASQSTDLPQSGSPSAAAFAMCSAYAPLREIHPLTSALSMSAAESG
mmetsp:Transcript_39488/g.93706  ORF Transcript_39488/g.93706 Transcript_39488/m.93706 type:complete len:282 (+) Transcript_39488:1163-2008(+)